MMNPVAMPIGGIRIFRIVTAKVVRPRTPGGRTRQYEWTCSAMVEAVVLWNVTNNPSHWNFHLARGGKRFGQMVQLASDAIRKANPGLPSVLGGISACDF